MRNYWLLKAAVQKTLSLMPMGMRINYLLQKFITGGVNLTETYFFDRISYTQAHLSACKKYGGQKEPKFVLELGSGWYPIVPLALWLSGAEEVVTIDIRKLYSRERLLQTLRMFRKQTESGNLQQYLTLVPGRVDILNGLLSGNSGTPFSEMLSHFHITPLTGDAGRLPLPANYFDLVISNNTLGHIAPEVLGPILGNTRKSGATLSVVHSHLIDLSDQFHQFDSSITPYHFLKFSARQWRLINNTLVPQNRLRIDDYRNLFSSNGFQILEEKNTAGSLAQLRQVKPDPAFATRPDAVNLVLSSHVIAKPALRSE